MENFSARLKKWGRELGEGMEWRGEEGGETEQLQ